MVLRTRLIFSSCQGIVIHYIRKPISAATINSSSLYSSGCEIFVFAAAQRTPPAVLNSDPLSFDDSSPLLDISLDQLCCCFLLFLLSVVIFRLEVRDSHASFHLKDSYCFFPPLISLPSTPLYASTFSHNVP